MRVVYAGVDDGDADTSARVACFMELVDLGHGVWGEALFFVSLLEVSGL